MTLSGDTLAAGDGVSVDPGVCFHCGLPAVGSRFEVVIDGQPRPMCCPGCQAVASTIVDGGLERFYAYRSADSARAAGEVETDYSAYDLPELAEEYLQAHADGSVSVELTLSGITCAACAWLIERHLATTAGVEQVAVNVSRHRCSLRWRPELNCLGALLAAFEAIGYQAVPAGADSGLDELVAEQRRQLLRLGVAGIGMMQAGMLAIALYAGAFQGMEARWENLLRWVSLLIATPVVCYAAAPFFRAALRSLQSAYLTMDVPVALAIGLAYTSSAWATISGGGEVYFDAVSMFTFFLLLGRFLELRVRFRNELSLGEAARALPASALRQIGRGEFEAVAVKSLRPADLIEIAEGATLPVDGEIVEGESALSEALLSGESRPVVKGVGATVYAGTVNSANRLLVRVTAGGRDTRLAHVIAGMDQALAEKPPLVALADRLSGWFVGAVLLSAGLVFAWWWQYEPQDALWVALSVLVVTCPCALSLATPVALTAATGFLRRRGLLLRRGHCLQALAGVQRVVFDKTGTLTRGELGIGEVCLLDHPSPVSREQALSLAAALERGCRHPIARALGARDSSLVATDLRHCAGGGVSGELDGRALALGSPTFVARHFDIEVPSAQGVITDQEHGYYQQVVLADRQGVLAWISLADDLRPGARAALERLSGLGLELELLSGDQPAAVARVARDLGIEKWRGACQPEDKLAHVQALQARGERVLMVGDGINDVPVLSVADTSIAIGDSTDFTRQASDAVLLSGDLHILAMGIARARKAVVVIRENLAWALAYNLAALPLAAAGWVPPWAAALGMSASSVLVVVNALRLQRDEPQCRRLQPGDSHQGPALRDAALRTGAGTPRRAGGWL